MRFVPKRPICNGSGAFWYFIELDPPWTPLLLEGSQDHGGIHGNGSGGGGSVFVAFGRGPRRCRQHTEPGAQYLGVFVRAGIAKALGGVGRICAGESSGTAARSAHARGDAA